MSFKLFAVAGVATAALTESERAQFFAGNFMDLYPQ